MIFQGGILLFAVGIIQILVSIDTVVLTGVSRYFPVGVVAINFCTALIITVFAHKEVLKITIPQYILFIIIMCLQLFSLWYDIEKLIEGTELEKRATTTTDNAH